MFTIEMQRATECIRYCGRAHPDQHAFLRYVKKTDHELSAPPEPEHHAHDTHEKLLTISEI